MHKSLHVIRTHKYDWLTFFFFVDADLRAISSKDMISYVTYIFGRAAWLLINCEVGEEVQLK